MRDFESATALSSVGAAGWSSASVVASATLDQRLSPPLLTARTRKKYVVEIQRSTGSAFVTVGKANADAQRFLDSGLRRSTTYTYRVRACNGNVCSPFSNSASATTPG
jgi:hypothetical protein